MDGLFNRGNQFLGVLLAGASLEGSEVYGAVFLASQNPWP